MVDYFAAFHDEWLNSYLPTRRKTEPKKIENNVDRLNVCIV